MDDATSCGVPTRSLVGERLRWSFSRSWPVIGRLHSRCHLTRRDAPESGCDRPDNGQAFQWRPRVRVSALRVHGCAVRPQTPDRRFRACGDPRLPIPDLLRIEVVPQGREPLPRLRPGAHSGTYDSTGICKGKPVMGRYPPIKLLPFAPIARPVWQWKRAPLVTC